MWKFIQDHIFEIIITVVVGLAGYIGQQELAHVNELVCKAVATSTAANYDDIASALGALSSFDDLNDRSKPIKRLQDIIDEFGRELAKCDSGKKVLTEANALLAGLHAYINKDYSAAAKQFVTMNMENSLPHALLGYAYSRDAETKTIPVEINQLNAKAADQFRQAHDIAKEEPGAPVKEARLMTLECKEYMVEKTENGNNLAVDCLNNLIKKKFSNSDTYYNLACMYSRLGNCEQSLESFKRYLDLGGAVQDSRMTPDHDHDFDNVRKSTCAHRFEELLRTYR